MSRLEYVQHLAKAQETLKKTEENRQKFFKAVLDIGMDFIRKSKRTKDDLCRACEMFKLANEFDLVEGSWKYACCLIIGLGTTKNPEKAKKILEQIQDRCIQAKFLYVHCFPRGDPTRGAIIKQLAEEGYPFAQWTYCLHLMYQNSTEERERGRKILDEVIKANKKSILNKYVVFLKTGRKPIQQDQIRAAQIERSYKDLEFDDDEHFMSFFLM